MGRALMLLLAVLLANLFNGAWSFSSGAPLSACDSLNPASNGTGHTSSPQQINTDLFAIDLLPFDNTGRYTYNPGETYTGTY